MKLRTLLVLLILALVCGGGFALFMRLSAERRSLPALSEEAKPPSLTVPARPPEGSETGNAGHSPLPDMSGLAVGSGRAGVDLPVDDDGTARMKQELADPSGDSVDGVSWPRTSGKVRELEEQLREIRDDVNEVTLEAVSKTLNALPFVSADPEEAEWHLSGGRIELEIRIPAEDIKIGNP